MKPWKLAVLILALPAGAFAQPVPSAEATWKEVAYCHFKITSRNADESGAEGQLDIYSMTPGDGAVPLYKASLQFIQPANPPVESTNVSANAIRDKSQIDELLSEDAGRALVQYARIPTDKMTGIAAIESYDMDHSADGSRAILFVFKDNNGNVLGKSGMTGWVPFGCDAN